MVQEGASLKKQFQLCTFDMAPYNEEKNDFFQKMVHENVIASRVKVNEIFWNFIVMFCWTKRSLKKQVRKF